MPNDAIANSYSMFFSAPSSGNDISTFVFFLPLASLKDLTAIHGFFRDPSSFTSPLSFPIPKLSPAASPICAITYPPSDFCNARFTKRAATLTLRFALPEF